MAPSRISGLSPTKNRFLVLAVIVVFALIGVLLGTGIARGQGWQHFLDPGNRHYTEWHLGYCDGCIYTNDSFIWTSSSETWVRVILTGHYYGLSPNPDVRFGLMYIYKGSSPSYSQTYTQWRCTLVKDVNTSKITYWERWGLVPGDDIVIVQEFASLVVLPDTCLFDFGEHDNIYVPQ